MSFLRVLPYQSSAWSLQLLGVTCFPNMLNSCTASCDYSLVNNAKAHGQRIHNLHLYLKFFAVKIFCLLCCNVSGEVKISLTFELAQKPKESCALFFI